MALLIISSNQDEENLIEVKAILVGDISVGKTSLINVTAGMRFNPQEKTTITSTFIKKIIEIDSKIFQINLWDTAGQEKLKSLTKLFIKGSQIVIFVYDITESNTFENLKKWIKDIEETLDGKYICGIVGNKKDLYIQEKVKEEMAKNFAKTKGMKFKVVSAKEDPKSFSDFLEELVKDGKDIFPAKNKISLQKDIKKKKQNWKC